MKIFGGLLFFVGIGLLLFNFSIMPEYVKKHNFKKKLNELKSMEIGEQVTVEHHTQKIDAALVQKYIYIGGPIAIVLGLFCVLLGIHMDKMAELAQKQSTG